jgi:5,10-methylene-tetrahydrofolate dehydrogenase/methenyl tetrahydrofolate cyclohydrolase
MEALKMMKTNTTVKVRAEKYATAIKRNLQADIIDVLVKRQEQIDSDIFDLQNFNLDTDVNAGQKAMTKEDCQDRFAKIIQLEYEMKIVELELKVKQESFDKYFAKTATK